MPSKLKLRKGVCAVVCRKRGSKAEFLLLHRVLHWNGWEFPKGGAKPKEAQLQTLRRELEEEIGVSEFLRINKIPAMQVFDDFIRLKKHVNQAFLVEIPASAKIVVGKNIDAEHSSFKWASKSAALKMLDFEDQKKVFRTALKRIV